MDIHFNSDNRIDGDAGMAQRVEDEIRSKMSRFEHRLTRVEVHVGDTNAGKGGTDKSCAIEARPRGMQPVAATTIADTVERAVSSAITKLTAALDTTFGRQDARR